MREGRSYYLRPLEGVRGITVHYTASPTRAGVQAVKVIAAYQAGPNAHEQFPALAYHLMVCGEGKVYWCHDLDVRAWHHGGVVDGVARNASHIGVCYIGAYEPNEAQFEGLRRAIKWCEAQLGRRLEVEGHRDTFSTRCPGATWAEWRGELRE